MDKGLDYYKILFKDSPCPMWVLEQESMRFLEVNDAAIRQYGYDKKEFLRMKLPDVRFNGEVHQGMKLKTVVGTQRSGAFYDLGNSCHKRKNGEAFYVHVYSQYILFNDKDCVLAYLMDDNERVQAEIENGKLLETSLTATHKLQVQNEQLNSIAWVQSHKVRSPLATLLGLVQLLKDGGNSETDIKVILEGIKAAGASLDDIIREIVENTKQIE